MFRNDQQRAAVCNAFLHHIGKPLLFTSDGASSTAVRYASEGCPWSSKESDFFRVAWALWSNEAARDVPFTELISGLDARSCLFLSRFLLALATGSDGLDVWLAELERTRLRPVE